MTDNRKKRILEHLARTSSDNQNLFIIKKKAQQVLKTTLPVEPLELAQPAPVEGSKASEPIKPSTSPTLKKLDSPRARIRAHLKISSGNFSDFSRTSQQRIQQIEQHIRSH